MNINVNYDAINKKRKQTNSITNKSLIQINKWWNKASWSWYGVEYLQQIDLEIMNLNDTFNIVRAYPNVFHNSLFLGRFL